MEWSTVLAHGIGYGLALSAVFTVALFAGAAISRDFLLNDYPQAIQERYGRPKSARGKRVAALFAVVVWGLCGIPLLAVAMIDLGGSLDGELGFLPAAVCGAVVFATLAGYDLVVIDWLILAGLRPRLLTIPGTEGMKEYRDLRFHCTAALKGSPLIPVAGLLTGATTALLT
jgi:hypothetical protein